MKLPQKLALSTLLVLVSGCAVVSTFFRATGTGGAAGAGALIGFVFGGGLGAAVGAFVAATSAYLLAENMATKEQLDKVTAKVHHNEQTLTLWQHVEQFTTHAIIGAVVLVAVLTYWRHKSLRAKINATLSKAWNAVFSKTKGGIA